MTGLDDTKAAEEWCSSMMTLLGWAPNDTELQGGRHRMSSLIGHIKLLDPIIDVTPEYEVQQRVHSYMMWIIGGLLAVDTSSNKVKFDVSTISSRPGQCWAIRLGSSHTSYIVQISLSCFIV